MIAYYDITESNLNSKSFEAEAIYFCNDTGRIFLDSIVTESRIRISNEIVIVSTPGSLPLAPITDRIYFVLSDTSIRMYHGGEWVIFSKRSQMTFLNITTNNGSATITDSRIKAVDTGVFVPDPSIADLVTASSVTCADGSATVSVTSSYDVFGTVLIN